MIEKEHKLNCLGRWMLDHWQTRHERRESLERMRRNIGDAFVADLEVRIRREWEREKNAE